MDRARTGLAARGISPRGVVQHQRTLRAAVVWATEQGLLPPTLVPIDRATGAPKARRDHTPTDTEAAAVIGLLDGDTRLAVTVMAVTGARVSEVTTLRRSAIDLSGGWLHLNGKTGPRRFPLVPELRALLAPRADRSEAPVFLWPVQSPNLLIHRQLLAACSRLGQPEFTAHGLRRMVVNSLLRAGADIKAAAELMGHTAEVMLKHYRRVSNDDKVAGVSKAGLGVPLVAKGRGGNEEAGHRFWHNGR
jgi:integrase